MEHLSVSENMAFVDDISDTATDVCIDVREDFIALAEKIETMMPHSRPRSLALTHLETALMYSINAIVHSPESTLG